MHYQPNPTIAAVPTRIGAEPFFTCGLLADLYAGEAVKRATRHVRFGAASDFSADVSP